MNRHERMHIFVHEIWQWYARHKRDLPWRDLKISDDLQRGYQIMISEIMLQQTQVNRVKIVFKIFLEQFPTIQDLAVASNKDVIIAWRGMGYNNRALRLRDAAKEIVERGEFPTDMKKLQSLPGIGHYTAAAIRNFAFDIPTACLDTNIRRILHRTFVGAEKADGTWPKDDKYLMKIAEEVLEIACDTYPDKQRAGAEWHAALMDFGSLVCTKTNPKWEICPLTAKGICKAAYKVPTLKKAKKKQEPGRYVGSTYVPNRIFRGKIVEELRDVSSGLDSVSIGQRICIDWSEKEHAEWLEGLLKALVRDKLITKNRKGFVLVD